MGKTVKGKNRNKIEEKGNNGNGIYERII
jgi:hypothetical protein